MTLQVNRHKLSLYVRGNRTDQRLKKRQYMRDRYRTDPSFRQYHNDYSKKYYKENREQLLARSVAYGHLHKKKKDDYNKSYYQHNKDRIQSQTKTMIHRYHEYNSLYARYGSKQNWPKHKLEEYKQKFNTRLT